MAAMKHTYYCIAIRFCGAAICGVFKTLESFTEEFERFYKVFETPSQMDTCSVRAYSESEAYKQAVKYFNDNGWNIIIPEKVEIGE